MEVCRLCLNTNELNSTLDENLLNKITSSLAISLSISNVLLRKICEPCATKIEEIYQYRKKVIDSEKKLMENASEFFIHKKIIRETESNSILSRQEIKQETLNPNAHASREYDKIYISTTTQTDISFMKEPRITLYDIAIKEEYIDCINPKIEFNENFHDDNYSSEDDLTLNNIIRTDDAINELKISRSNRKKIQPIKKLLRNKLKKKEQLKINKKEQSNRDYNIKINTDETKNNFSNLTEEKSLKNDIKKKFQCLICFTNCISKLKLISHYKDHTLNPRKFILQEYTNQENEDVLNIFSKKGYKFVDSPEFRQAQSYQCLKCLKLFTTETLIEKHVVNHDDSRPFPCNKCGRTYKKTYDLQIHGKVHNEEKTLFCKYDQCNYSTFYKGALNAHHKKHAPDFKYTCKICNKGFNILTWFNEHKNFHTGSKPFVCDFCGKSYQFSRYLTTHRKQVHPDENPNYYSHFCQDCTKEFNTKRQLKKHLIDVHGAKNKEEFLCDICGKALSNKQHLILHIRIHTGEKPYACRSCGKAFAKKCNLTLHERVHSGERPHVCSQCGKAFSQRSTLVIHERYHSGYRPYRCEKCEKGFVSKGSLSVHFKTCPFQPEIKYSNLIKP